MKYYFVKNYTIAPPETLAVLLECRRQAWREYYRLAPDPKESRNTKAAMQNARAIEDTLDRRFAGWRKYP